MTHPTLVNAVLSGSTALAEVQAAADYLAKAMQRIHGGRWRTKIDHDNRLVFVVGKEEEDPINPKPEVA